MPRPRCAQLGMKSFSKWIGQELCFLTSGGTAGSGEGEPHQCTEQAPVPASCSTMLQLSWGLDIPAWHKRPALPHYSELPTSQKCLTWEKTRLSPGWLVTGATNQVPNRKHTPLCLSVWELPGAQEKAALQAATRPARLPGCEQAALSVHRKEPVCNHFVPRVSRSAFKRAHKTSNTDTFFFTLLSHI